MTEDTDARRHHSTLQRVDVIGAAPSRNSRLRWMIVIIPVLLIVLGGGYMVNLFLVSLQQAPEERRATGPRPVPAKNTENPVPSGKSARRAPKEEGSVGGETGFDVEVVLRLIPTADPNAGATAFKLCIACHSADRGAPHKIGPNLWGIVGARKATLPDFRYSRSLRAEGGSWSYAELARYLHDTRNAVPGTSMAFAGIKDTKRMADLLAYMRTRADRPMPLPK
jgi:cytochrome c